MKEKRFSDRVYTTLLWEFMKFAKAELWDSGFAQRSFEMMKTVGDVSEEEATELLRREDVLKAIEFTAPGLFIDFLLENPQMFNERELLEWVKTKQPNYPF